MRTRTDRNSLWKPHAAWLGFVLALGLVGCTETTDAEAEQTAELQRALPDEADLALRVPASDTADEAGRLYTFTVDVSSSINGWLRAVLQPITRVINIAEPALVNDDRLVWFGREDGRDVMLVVERHDDGHSEFSTVERPIGSGKDGWKFVVSGTHTPAAGGHARGAIWLNLDNDRDPQTSGKILALWSNLAERRTVTVNFYGSAPGTGGNASYHYEEEASGRGKLVYALADVDIDGGTEGRELLEDAVVVSRWTPAGNGRSDLWATGGDVAREGFEVALIIECWNAPTFGADFESVWVKRANEDAQAVSASGEFGRCAFEQPGDAVLPDVSVVPPDPPLPPEAED